MLDIMTPRASAGPLISSPSDAAGAVPPLQTRVPQSPLAPAAGPVPGMQQQPGMQAAQLAARLRMRAHNQTVQSAILGGTTSTIQERITNTQLRGPKSPTGAVRPPARLSGGPGFSGVAPTAPPSPPLSPPSAYAADAPSRLPPSAQRAAAERKVAKPSIKTLSVAARVASQVQKQKRAEARAQAQA